MIDQELNKSFVLAISGLIVKVLNNQMNIINY